MHWYWDTLKTELGDVHWSGTGTPSKQCWMDAHWYWDTLQSWVDVHWYWDTLKTVLGGCALVLGHPQNRVGWMHTGTETPSEQCWWMHTSTGTPPPPKKSWAWVDVHWYWDTLKEGAEHISGWWVFQCLTILG